MHREVADVGLEPVVVAQAGDERLQHVRVKLVPKKLRMSVAGRITVETTVSTFMTLLVRCETCET